VKKYKLLRLLSEVLALSFVLIAAPFSVAAYTGPFSYSHVFENIPPRLSMHWGSPTPTFRGITCKWNQPRDVGTNPHAGIDMDTALTNPPTALLAVWCGWLREPLRTTTTEAFLTKLLDLNQNGIQDDPVMFVNYYHVHPHAALNGVPESPARPGYYRRGDRIGSVGSSHIHWGGTTAGSFTTRWFRNEVNYRHLSDSVWRGGRDVDTFSRVSWNNNVARITAYFRTTQLTSPPPAEVRIFHRRSGTNAWTDGGTMTAEPGDVFAFNFTGRYPANTNVDWLVRIMRGSLPTNIYPWAWAPARYNQPHFNPNDPTTRQRPFYTNTIN
jgi:hypothetical protein